MACHQAHQSAVAKACLLGGIVGFGPARRDIVSVPEHSGFEEADGVDQWFEHHWEGGEISLEDVERGGRSVAVGPAALSVFVRVCVGGVCELEPFSLGPAARPSCGLAARGCDGRRLAAV